MNGISIICGPFNSLPPRYKIVALQGFSNEVIPFIADHNSVVQEVKNDTPKIKSIFKSKLAEWLKARIAAWNENLNCTSSFFSGTMGNLLLILHKKTRDPNKLILALIQGAKDFNETQ